MRAAVRTVDATPKPGTFLGGYARLLDARGVRDPLTASVAVFDDDDGGAAALFCLDVVFAHRRWVDALTARVRDAIGDPDARVVVACSHSHSTPYATHGAPERRFQAYADRLADLCVTLADDAWRGRADATLAFGRADVADVSINRRLDQDDGLVDFGWNDDGPTDPDVRVLELISDAGERLGVLANYGCHPICLPPWSRDASADWVGEMRRAVAAKAGAPCLFVQGPCADVSPRHEWLPRRFGPRDVRGPHAAASDGEACAVIGGRVATRVLHALAHAEAIDSGPVAGVDASVAVPVVPDLGADGNPVPYWHGVTGKRLPRWLVDRLLARAFPWDTPVTQMPDGASVDLHVGALRIGDFALASHGSEAFAATGADVLGASPTPHTFFAGYTNGMVGYIPPPEEIPRRGYEVATVPYLYRLPGLFGGEGERAAVAASRAQLASLFAH